MSLLNSQLVKFYNSILQSTHLFKVFHVGFPLINLAPYFTKRIGSVNKKWVKTRQVFKKST